uniref:Uncharacterized protein n=1 Tax=Arundo donax TaxID=35708 RepID=A0A0A9G225_ARUDO
MSLYRTLPVLLQLAQRSAKSFSSYSLSNNKHYIAYLLTKSWFVVAQITSMENVDMKSMAAMDAKEFNMPQQLVCL